MACEVKILTTVYNPETKKKETQPLTIGIVDETEQVTMDRVVELISTLSASDRESLAASIVKAKRQTLTNKMVGEHQFVGNTTVEEILSKYPLLAETYKINPRLYDKYTIIRSSNFRLNNVNYNGRVLTADGQELFIIKDIYGATAFIKYLQAKEKAEEIFGDEGAVPDNILPYMEDLKTIAKRYGKSVKDVVLEYLNNKDSLKPFVSKASTITPRQILGRVVAELTGDYNFDENLTDLEIGVSSIKADGTKYDWKLPKAELYTILTTYFPDFGQQLSLENFRNLTNEELDALFTGPNGLFVGNPKLGRARVKSATRGSQKVIEPKEATTKKVGKLTHDVLKATWDVVRSQAAEAGIGLPVKYSEYAKADPESMANIFNSAGFQYSDPKTGQTHTIHAKVVEDRSGRKKVEYSYEYEVVNEPKVKESASYITLTFPYASIGEIYNFGYNTQSIFSPVDEGEVVAGKYNGMYVYKATLPTIRGNQTVYAISRSIISPNSYMSTYPSLAAAVEGVNRKVATDRIGANGLITIKQSGDIPRQSNLELDNVQEGQIVTTLALDLPRLQIEKLPTSVRQILNLTVPEFQKFLSVVPDITKLDTPEKAAAFILLVTDSLSRNDSREITKAKNLTTLVELLKSGTYTDTIASIIDTIDKAPARSYYVEKLVVSKETEHRAKRKVATLKLLEDGGNSVDVTGSKVGDVSIDEFIGQTMNGAIDFFNRQYGLDVVSMTSSELLAFSRENNLNLENNIDGIKAFIYNNRIYINTTNAKTSDLFHEISHIFLGVLKARYPEGYQQILDEYQKKSGFKRKFSWISNAYSNFAMQDKIEEAVVDMIADEMFRDNKLSVGFNSDRFTEIMQDIINRVDSFKQDMMDNGLGFNDFIKTLMTENSGKLQRQRIITNFIQSKLGNEITEDCK